ncbi:MAG TPA: hypothetical protein VNS58_07840 [Puia sp.]|jgi:hypothetical protein|nr:hypothetical protein [Puia sp.]
MADEIQKLQLKVTELENQLKALSAGRQQVDPEEYKTYQKVSQQLGLSGCISECAQCISCYHCYQCFTCARCITECTCGPCAGACILSTSGGARFGSLG